ncbi:hypothetical protein B0H14DRAFT_2186353, partial [Mycena olivaceomarginata]
MSDPLSNLRAAYEVLETRVLHALRTQLGDTARLHVQRDEALRLLEAAEPHHHLFPPAEFATLQQSISTMADQLDEACHLSTDPPEGSSLIVVTECSNGRRGWPKKQIGPSFLQEALTLCGPSGISGVLNCHPRTVHRCALEHGITQPGVPVYVSEMQTDGHHICAYTAESQPVQLTLSDSPLDAAIGEILEISPAFGRSMINGQLKASGHEVTHERIVASYLR